jgi:hypothetical protein
VRLPFSRRETAKVASRSRSSTRFPSRDGWRALTDGLGASSLVQEPTFCAAFQTVCIDCGRHAQREHPTQRGITTRAPPPSASSATCARSANTICECWIPTQRGIPTPYTACTPCTAGASHAAWDTDRPPTSRTPFDAAVRRESSRQTAGSGENAGRVRLPRAVPSLLTLYTACAPCTAGTSHAAWDTDVRADDVSFQRDVREKRPKNGGC